MKNLKYIGLFIIFFIVGQYLLVLFKKTKSNTEIERTNLYEKYSKNKLTRIQVPLLIDFGRVSKSEIQGEITIKNVGSFNLSDLKVSGDCSCTDIGFKSKRLEKGNISIVLYKIDLSEEKGWFNKTINLEGSFFPYKRSIRIEGYKL